MKEVVLAAYNQSQTTILQYDNKTKQCINSVCVNVHVHLAL